MKKTQLEKKETQQQIKENANTNKQKQQVVKEQCKIQGNTTASKEIPWRLKQHNVRKRNTKKK